MKTILIILSLTLIGCATPQGQQKVIKSGPFTIIEKHPDQEKNLKEAPEWIDNCEWVIPGTPSAYGCE